jgi:hypothetical protein
MQLFFAQPRRYSSRSPSPDSTHQRPANKTSLPAGWKAGDKLILTPTMSLGWNDSQETGRCYVDLAISVFCEGREGFLAGMIPINPNIYDFSKDAE